MSNRAMILAFALLAVGVGGYAFSRSDKEAAIVGIIRATEIRVAPQIGGQLKAIRIHRGETVRAGDIVAELYALEVTAAVAQARANWDAAMASREHVYAGVRAEEIAVLEAAIAKAKAKLEYGQAQLTRTASLTQSNAASQEALDQAERNVAAARADVAAAQANHAAAIAGPTREERAIADAQVKIAASALEVLERRLDKAILRAPTNGVVSVIIAEVGENIRAGQPVLVIEQTGKRWLSFNIREDRLRGLTVGAKIEVERPGTSNVTRAILTELVPLGPFAPWQADRAVGAHDLNTLRLRLDPPDDAVGFEPGMTIRIRQ